jgi:hypothetical protein
MAGIAAIMGPLGGVLSGVGTIFSGIQANAAAKFEAKQMKAKGDAEFAKSQREGIQHRKEKDLVLSRQRAVAAASGGGASDPSITEIMSKTEQQGEYNAMVDMYNGATARNDLYRSAAVRKKEGKSALFGSFLKAGSTIFSGFSG